MRREWPCGWWGLGLFGASVFAPGAGRFGWPFSWLGYALSGNIGHPKPRASTFGWPAVWAESGASRVSGHPKIWGTPT